MNVILLEKIGKLGEIGDTTSVKAGYARNFLFPQGKAMPATRTNLEHFEERKSELLAAHNEKMGEMQKRAVKVKGLVLRIEVNASDEGSLFGSVGTKDIADAINEKVGSDLNKSEVMLPHGVIRALGEYEVAIDFGYDVGETVKLVVAGLESDADISDDGNVIAEIEAAEAAETDEPSEAQ
jgi:large subunit ribosomal protein L9